MSPPPIQVFLTTIASEPALRKRQEYILQTLQVNNVPFTSYDIASDEAAKKFWRRRGPRDNQQLPGLLVGGETPGTFAQFEYAAENEELTTFLRLKEDWVDDGSMHDLVAHPVGVPGASLPMQMTPERIRTKIQAGIRPAKKENKSAPVNKIEDFDLSTELDGFGLQGVRVTEDELWGLVNEMGLGGKEAEAVVKRLSMDTSRLSMDRVRLSIDMTRLSMDMSAFASGTTPSTARTEQTLIGTPPAKEQKLEAFMNDTLVVNPTPISPIQESPVQETIPRLESVVTPPEVTVTQEDVPVVSEPSPSLDVFVALPSEALDMAEKTNEAPKEPSSAEVPEPVVPSPLPVNSEKEETLVDSPTKDEPPVATLTSLELSTSDPFPATPEFTLPAFSFDLDAPLEKKEPSPTIATTREIPNPAPAPEEPVNEAKKAEAPAPLQGRTAAFVDEQTSTNAIAAAEEALQKHTKNKKKKSFGCCIIS